MKRKIYKVLTVLLAVLSVVVITACGGGGGSTTTASNSNSTVLDGIASKGPIANGTVSVYAVENGQKGKLLMTTTTGQDGSFTANLGSYSGPMMVEVTGGAYKDEATGNTVQMGSMMLRTALNSASGTVTVAVTPITEMAVQSMGTTMTSDAISAANSMMASKFSMTDIVHTKPHDVSTTAEAGKDNETYYGLMLAAMSQMSSKDNTSIPTIMSTIASTVNDTSATGIQTLNTMMSTMAQRFTDFQTTNSNNKTGVKTMSPMMSTR